MVDREEQFVVHDAHDRIYGPTRQITHPNPPKPTSAPEQPAPAEPEVAKPTPDEPPLGGPGSGRDAWAAYAEELGLTVERDMTRDDIVVLTRQHTGG